MSRHIRKTYLATPFDVVETQLCQELNAYYAAIYSYPDRFAETRVSFHRHLLNVLCAAQAEAAGGELARMKSAS